jgi:hypothetical protein
MTRGAVRRIAKVNACLGKRCVAHGAGASRFAGYLKAVFIGIGLIVDRILSTGGG